MPTYFPGIRTYEEMYRVTTTVFRYVKLVAMMMIVAHWNGCLHFLVPMLQEFPEGCWVSSGISRRVLGN